MSDAAKNDDIEDVLSSIRRLVSDTDSPSTRDTGGDRLILTSALRVAEPDDPFVAVTPGMSDDAEAELVVEAGESASDADDTPTETDAIPEHDASDSEDREHDPERAEFADADFGTPEDEDGFANEHFDDAAEMGLPDMADATETGAEVETDDTGEPETTVVVDTEPRFGLTALTGGNSVGWPPAGEKSADDTSAASDELSDTPIEADDVEDAFAPEADVVPFRAALSEQDHMEELDPDTSETAVETSDPDLASPEFGENDAAEQAADASTDEDLTEEPDHAWSQHDEAGDTEISEDQAEAREGDAEQASDAEDTAEDAIDAADGVPPSTDAEFETSGDDTDDSFGGSDMAGELPDQPAPEDFAPIPDDTARAFEPEHGDTNWPDDAGAQAAMDIAAVRFARGAVRTDGPPPEPVTEPEEPETDGPTPVFSRALHRDHPVRVTPAETEPVPEETDLEAETDVVVPDDEDSQETAVPMPSAERPGIADEAFDAEDDEDLGVLDEEALRELISEIVREELQGALGQRITRNVRKMVRREIRLALAAEEFE